MDKLDYHEDAQRLDKLFLEWDAPEYSGVLDYPTFLAMMCSIMKREQLNQHVEDWFLEVTGTEEGDLGHTVLGENDLLLYDKDLSEEDCREMIRVANLSEQPDGLLFEDLFLFLCMCGADE